MGVPTSGLKHIPTGENVTVLVNVREGGTNASNGTLFLHGCVTVNLENGSAVSVTLDPLVLVDMAMSDTGGPVDDLASPPPDMAVHKFLSINVVEARALLRKVGSVAVTVTDKNGVSVSGTSDAVTGNLKLDVTGMVVPFSIVAAAPAINSYQGGVVLLGVTPTFTTDTATMSLAVELDPPPVATNNCITGTTTANTPATYTAYGMSSNALYTADQTSAAGAGGSFTLNNLVANQSYRVALFDSATPALWTPAPVTSASNNAACTTVNNITFGTNASGIAFAQPFSITPHLPANAVYTTNKFAVDVTLPASSATASIPIVPPTSFAANTQVTGFKVPTNAANGVHPSAVVLTELTGDGTGVHAELRHQMPATTGSSDTFSAGVPDPPMVSPSPTPLPATDPLTITATPPAGFLMTNAFVHVIIQDSGNLYHVHAVIPATNPTTIVLPGNTLLPGTYTVTVAFIAPFTLADPSVAAELADDWTKLIRPVAQQLTQSTLSLTVN
jgi:hypothetical protein